MKLSEYLDKKQILTETSEKYKQVFNSLLKKYDVKTPKELNAANKKKFFKELDDLWVSNKEVELTESFNFWCNNKKNINNDYNKLLFEAFIIGNGESNNTDLPVDFETWYSLNKDELAKRYNSADYKTLEDFANSEYQIMFRSTYEFNALDGE
jgi:hypothetical protein